MALKYAHPSTDARPRHGTWPSGTTAHAGTAWSPHARWKKEAARGSGFDGAEISVHGDAQDQVGQILKSGRLVIYGSVGQTFLYGAKGGDAFVLGSAAGRPLIIDGVLKWPKEVFRKVVASQATQGLDGTSHPRFTVRAETSSR
jgi:hypothetical protein